MNHPSVDTSIPKLIGSLFTQLQDLNITVMCVGVTWEEKRDERELRRVSYFHQNQLLIVPVNGGER